MDPGVGLRRVCGELLERSEEDALTIQVARVLSCLVSEGPHTEGSIRGPTNVYETFKTQGLVPERLSDSIRTFFPQTNSDAPAVCFAASIYPQRAHLMDSTVLRMRVRSLASFFNVFTRHVSPFEALSYHLSTIPGDAGLGNLIENLEEVLSDLSAVPPRAFHDSSRDPEASEQRFNGAIFYLSSCHSPLVERIYGHWSQEAPFVRTFRTYFPAPPSSLNSSTRRAIAEVIGKAFCKRAMSLEEKSRFQSRHWPTYLITSESFQEAWEGLFTKLNSGFPYYAFHSGFETWWRPSFRYYKFDKQTAFVDANKWQFEAAAQSPVTLGGEQRGLSIDELRVFREGYRLVRSTFYSRDGDPQRTKVLRKALDEMWYHHLEERIRRGGIHRRSLDKTIDGLTGRYPVLNAKALETAYNRLRLRMWAYTLGRVRRLTNNQIRFTKRPRGYEKPGRKPWPLKDEKGVLAVASLAKTMTWEYSLLGPFTAQVSLNWRLNSRYARWDFPAFVMELWHWLSDKEAVTHVADCVSEGVQQSPGRPHQRRPFEFPPESTEYNLKYGSKRGHLVDGAIVKVMENDTFKSLLEDLRTIESEEELESYVRVQGFEEQRTKVSEMVEKLAGSRGFHVRSGPCKQCLGWSKRVGTHWIVPLWYLSVPEQMQQEGILERLRVDEEEQPAVSAVIERFKNCPSSCTPQEEE